jgi:hypothetical protein
MFGLVMSSGALRSARSASSFARYGLLSSLSSLLELIHTITVLIAALVLDRFKFDHIFSDLLLRLFIRNTITLS